MDVAVNFSIGAWIGFAIMSSVLGVTVGGFCLAAGITVGAFWVAFHS